MSAYVVQDECINAIVTWLFSPRSDREWERIRVLETIVLTSSNHAEQLGSAMFVLNCNAVEQRYGVGQAQEFRDLDYEYISTPLGSNYAVYDRLGEFLYQCSEGDVPETSKLYQALQGVYDRMAHTFFRGLRDRDLTERNEVLRRIAEVERKLAS